jgi:CarD family transcriptional regulator
MSKKIVFGKGDYVVYPTHGVGEVTDVSTQKVAGSELDLIVVRFDKERMTLRVPVKKATESGLRQLSSKKQMEKALSTLKGKARVKRTMWSRRAQEYEAKINSGCPVSIAEVVRDLHRKDTQPEQSYSERLIYEEAMGRLAHELAAVENTNADVAAVKLSDYLNGK